MAISPDVQFAARLGAAPLREQAMKPEPSASASAFGAMLGDLASEAVRSIRDGERIGAAGVIGAAPVQQVVDALLTAERNLQTAIAVRDKLVSGFQEISRMSI